MSRRHPWGQKYGMSNTGFSAESYWGSAFAAGGPSDYRTMLRHAGHVLHLLKLG